MIYNNLFFQRIFELDLENTKSFGYGDSKVLHLTKNLKLNSHFLFFDNYYLFIGFIEKIFNLKIYTAGTIRTIRLADLPILSDGKLRKMKISSTIETTTNFLIIVI